MLVSVSVTPMAYKIWSSTVADLSILNCHIAEHQPTID
jgi:hypothetical protein